VDINPHTVEVTPYALAGMLEFSSRGEPVDVGDVVERIAHMIYAGKPDRVQGRRDWIVWELNRLGAADWAQRIGYLVDTQGETVPLPAERR
jgi:hypothetical protein